MIAKYRFSYYEMLYEGKLKSKSHNTSCCSIEVVTELTYSYLWFLA